MQPEAAELATGKAAAGRAAVSTAVSAVIRAFSRMDSSSSTAAMMSPTFLIGGVDGDDTGSYAVCPSRTGQSSSG